MSIEQNKVKMKAKVQKRELLSRIKDVFKENGFYKESSPLDFSFTKQTEYGAVHMWFTFSDSLSSSGDSLFCLSHKEVEDIIIDIEFPNFNFEEAKAGLQIFYTVKDYDPTYPFLFTPTMFGSKRQVDIQSIDDIERWASAVKNYIANKGAAFEKKYSSLPNVFIEIERLYAMINENNAILLTFLNRALDHFFRLLIISKLCNDTGYEEKLNFVSSIISQEEYSKWIPHFNALKERLDKLQPKYNL